MRIIFCVFFATSVVFTLGATPQEKLREHSDACKSETGVSEETLTKARNGETVDDPKVKDHALCILKKAGFITDGGDFQTETIKQKLKDAGSSQESIDKAISKCAVKKETPKESAAHFFSCVIEGKKKN